MINKTFQLTGAVLTASLLWTAAAWAEGSVLDDGIVFTEGGPGRFGGNNGLNRVVRTNGSPAGGTVGFVGVGGDLDLSFSMPANANGRFSPEFNPFNNKPSMYVGGQVRTSAGIVTEVDGGVQFEPSTFPSEGILAPVGWSVFFYVGAARVTPKTYVGVGVPNGNPWRGGTFTPTPGRGGGSIDGRLTVQVNSDGRPTLTYPRMSTTYNGVTSDTIHVVQLPRDGNPPRNAIPVPAHPLAPWSDATNPVPVLLDTRALQNSNMKHVVALTRTAGAGSKLDGLTMTGTWSGLELLSPNLPAPAPSGGWITWTWNQVNQRRTGYDAPRVGALAFNRRYNGRPTTHSDVTVRFSGDDTVNTEMRAPFVATTEPPHSGRYPSETVSYDLSMIARPVGNPVE